MKKYLLSLAGSSLLATGAALSSIAPAHAQTFTFSDIVPSDDGALAADSLGFNLSSIDADTVQFTFFNNDLTSDGFFIDGIYFDDVDDAPILNFSTFFFDSVASSDNVDFSEGATPPSLPSGQNLDPVFDTDFATDADAPGPQNGISGDQVGVFKFDLNAGSSYQDLLSALNANNFRVGLQVQGFSSGGSEQLVTHGGDNGNGGDPEPIPEPAAMAGLVAVGAGIVLNRRKKALQA